MTNIINMLFVIWSSASILEFCSSVRNDCSNAGFSVDVAFPVALECKPFPNIFKFEAYSLAMRCRERLSYVHVLKAKSSARVKTISSCDEYVQLLMKYGMKAKQWGKTVKIGKNLSRLDRILYASIYGPQPQNSKFYLVLDWEALAKDFDFVYVNIEDFDEVFDISSNCSDGNAWKRRGFVLNPSAMQITSGAVDPWEFVNIEMVEQAVNIASDHLNASPNDEYMRDNYEFLQKLWLEGRKKRGDFKSSEQILEAMRDESLSAEGIRFLSELLCKQKGQRREL